MKVTTIAALLVLGGCTTAQTSAQLQANGVSAPTAQKIATIQSTLVADGTLFCEIDGIVAAVPGVSVVNATAQTVAAACATAQVVGGAIAAATPVPVPPPATAATVPIATVAPAAAAAVVASVKPAS